MDPEDFLKWTEHEQATEEQNQKNSGVRSKGPRTEEEEDTETQLFEAVSKRAWMDVCLQLLKVGLRNAIYFSRLVCLQWKQSNRTTCPSCG